MKKENIRDMIMLSGNHRIILLLKTIEKNPNLGFGELSKELTKTKPKKLSGGTFWHTLKDCRIMKVVENGYGFHLSELGIEFLHNFSQEVNKKTHLNVPLFRQCYEELPNETDYVKVRDWFLLHLTDFDKKLKGTVIRRYLEGVYGVKVQKRPRVNIKQQKISANYHIIKEAKIKNITYYEFLKNKGFSDDKIIEILTKISDVPEHKQEIILKIMFKEFKM